MSPAPTHQGPWRIKPAVTEDYPGLQVQDNRVTGSINVGPTRLPLWAIIHDVITGGWETAEASYDVTPNLLTEHQFTDFLYHLLEQRGEFGRLVCVLADVERRERKGDKRPWWERPKQRRRVRAALTACLQAVDAAELEGADDGPAE